ncbi:MAG: M90 family metallopeptidase [Pseudomonadota bacterium]
MLRKLKEWRERRILAKSPFSDSQWARAAARLAILDRLDPPQLKHLFDLSTLFLHDKTLTGAAGFTITDDVRQSIALQASLPILNLGIDWYDGWTSVIVYPGAFKRHDTHIDEYGIAHTGDVHLSGEAWLRGPVVLSWTDVAQAGERDGQNVVIHEFVHKLDMLNGRANGFPPMQKGMDQKSWSALMSDAFDDFQNNPKSGLDRYGATNPAEFFAVLSEVFFETPELLIEAYSDVYDLMVSFFQQTPVKTQR